MSATVLLEDVMVERAVVATSRFIQNAELASNPREASDWALAAKNMAATTHSLIGAVATQRRSA